MPSTGTYTYNYTAGALNILKFAAVPTSQYTSNTTWGNGILVVNAKIREDVTPFDFVTGDYHTAFPNMSGVATRPAQIYANIDGTLKAVKKVYANIDGVLTELTPVYSSSVSTSGPDVMAVYPFTPPVSGTYQIINEQVSGYIEARLYDSAFNQINMSAEYTPSPLVGGQTYYLSLTSNIGDENGANSLVFIYKKD
jgi:hypothetical protein